MKYKSYLKCESCGEDSEINQKVISFFIIRGMQGLRVNCTLCGFSNSVTDEIIWKEDPDNGEEV